MDILELVKRRQIMTTTENKPKRKRGRPKKVETVAKQEPVVESKINTSQLNQVWGGSIYYTDAYGTMEAGRFTFHSPSKDMRIDPMFEDRKTAAWNNLVLALRGGVYQSTDSVTGTVVNHALDSENPVTWIENIETATWNFGGGTYTAKDLNKRYED